MDHVTGGLRCLGGVRLQGHQPGGHHLRCCQGTLVKNEIRKHFSYQFKKSNVNQVLVLLQGVDTAACATLKKVKDKCNPHSLEIIFDPYTVN